MALSAARTTEKSHDPTILQRITGRDKTAVKDCIDAYGDVIWSLARKFTASSEEAARATEEIFIDIWQYRGRDRDAQAIERKVIAMIALRRLVKPSGQAKKRSKASMGRAE